MHARTSDAMSDDAADLARSKDELVSEFRNLVSAGDALLRSTTSVSGEALAQARDQFSAKLADAKGWLGDASRTALDKGRYAAGATDEYDLLGKSSTLFRHSLAELRRDGEELVAKIEAGA